MVSPVASLTELSFKQVLRNNQQNDLTPIIIRDVAENILQTLPPLIQTVPTINSPVPFAEDSPEHRVRALFRILTSMLPETSSSRSLASMIDQIGSGSRYTSIVDRSGELISFPDANQAMEARTSALSRAAARYESWDPLTVALLLSTGPISEERRVELLEIAATNTGRGVDTEIARLLLAKGPISKGLRGELLRDAIFSWRTKITRLLLANGPISKGLRGELLRFAAKEHYLKLVKLLLAHGPISEELIKQALRCASKCASKNAAGTAIRHTLKYAAEYAEIISLLSERIPEHAEAVFQTPNHSQASLNALLVDDEEVPQYAVPLQNFFVTVRTLLAQPISEQERQAATTLLVLTIMTAAIAYYIQSYLSSER